MKSSLVEWKVPCDWCGAKIGEPCKDHRDTPYENGMVHITRKRTYDTFISSMS